jgi:hypothetical protein
MRAWLPFLLLSAWPIPATAAALEYTCKLEKTVGPISATSGAVSASDDKTKKEKAPARFVYDAASEQAAASDESGALAPALAIKIGGGIKFISGNSVTTITDKGEFHRVTTGLTDGKLTSTIGIGRCEMKETRLASQPFSDR